VAGDFVVRSITGVRARANVLQGSSVTKGTDVTPIRMKRMAPERACSIDAIGGPSSRQAAAIDRLQRLDANRAMIRCARGADEAFDEVYAYLAPRLFRMLLRRTGDRRRAERLLGQWVSRMLWLRESFDAESDVIRWAYDVLRTHFMNDRGELALTPAVS